MIIVGDGDAFAAGRVILDEAELLTIAVAPAKRRKGLAEHALGQLETAMHARGAARCFLEVAADNTGAIALYSKSGYTESGRRRDYYGAKNVSKTDALIMVKPLKAP